MIHLPLARRVLWNEAAVGFPDLRIPDPLRLPIGNFAHSGLLAESLPAHSGGTVLDLHQLPRHYRRVPFVTLLLYELMVIK